MKYIRLLAILVFVNAVTGCASGIKYTDFQQKMPSISQDTGRIFFYRPSSFGAAIRPDVMLNNEKVGEAISHGFFYEDQSPASIRWLRLRRWSEH